MNKYNALFMFLLILVENHPSLQAVHMMCHNKDNTPNELTFYRQDDDDLQAVEFDFASQPLLSKELSCTSWLNEVRSTDWFDSTKLEFKRLVPLEQNHVRLQGTLKNKLYEHCLNSSRCKLRFPYTLHNPLAALSSFFVNPPPKLAGDKICSQKPRKPLRSNGEVTHLESTDASSYWLSPIDVYSEPLQRLIRESGNHSVMINSMTISSSQILEINKFAKQKKEGKVYILFDLNIPIKETTFTTLSANVADNVVLMPMISTPTHSHTYHVKGATDTLGSSYVYTSSNLRGQSSSSNLDVGLIGNKGTFSNELAQLYAHLLKENCIDTSFLKCHLEHGYADIDSDEKSFVHALVQKSCRTVLDDSNLARLAQLPYRAKHLLYSGAYQIEAEVLRQLEYVKNKVTITGSLVTNRAVIQKLNKLHLGGVKVSVISELEIDSRLHEGIYALKTTGFHLHSKYLMIDNDRLVWSTSNYSTTGLTHSREFLFTIQRKDWQQSSEIRLAKRTINGILNINHQPMIYSSKDVGIAKSLIPYDGLKYLLYSDREELTKAQTLKLERVTKLHRKFWGTNDPACLKDNFQKALTLKLSDWLNCRKMADL